MAARKATHTHLSKLDEYLARTEPNDKGCLLWQGANNGRGYGRVYFKGKYRQLHRVIYELVNGEIPKFKFILHTCDEPSCINIDHLYMGTLSENSLDRERRNRIQRHVREEHPLAKLNWEAVKVIRYFIRKGYGPQTIANAYRMPCGTIHNVAVNKTWREDV
jgi:hypothetical protein